MSDNKFINNYQSENSSNSFEKDEIEIQEIFTNELELDSIEPSEENHKEDHADLQDPTNTFNINSIQLSKQMKDLEDNLKQSKIEESLKEEKNYVILKNIEENTTVEEIQEFFQRCGEIKNISLMINTLSNHKYCAIIEFALPESKTKALTLDKTLFKNMVICIKSKKGRLSNYLTRKCKFINNFLGKYLNYHVYMNFNESNNKYMRDLYMREDKSSYKSCIGPMKAKYANNKIFEPY